MDEQFSYKFFNTTRTAWDAMYAAISRAQKSIYWEVYIFVDDASGARFVDLLCEKARAGLDVKIVVDALGSKGLSNSGIKRLKSSGAKVLAFHRLAPDFNLRGWWNDVWRRTHRKVLIIDSAEAFIGGVNVEHGSAEWDDLLLELSGEKIIRPLARGFAKSYLRSGGERKDVRELLHPKITRGLEEWREKINFILHSPVKVTRHSPLQNFYAKALGVAKESFNLLTPYYAPDRNFLELVSRARKRGVKVNIIMPWRTDVKLMEYMARALYGVSEKAGAAFHFLRKMNHGKAVSVDSALGMVGSANLTPRSLFMNQEAGVVFSDAKMVDELNHILDDWKSQADPLLEVGFKKRGWAKRFKDWWVKRLRDYV
ncbi:phosphatidylserine/phosphatidylglycerophosphate/cardiolipin synthase family protein [Patescibacteria group bacterium]|nr:MAG: phosphatidylserine/phosphatidylglycerophosphate/cardiolipin synthase family protein [Patescibacteria group bacterium]